MTDQTQKAQTFYDLHHQPTAFVIPNPWDAGSAKILAGMGFQALATTSAGLAHAMGFDDGELTVDQVLEHCRLVAGATNLPVSVDFEDGFGATPAAIANNITRLAETGVVGASIEDFSGGAILDVETATRRLAAAVEAAAKLPFKFTITGRAENLIRGNPDLNDTVMRLKAYSAVGCDVLYAPGLANTDQIRQVVEQVDKPINVLGVMAGGASVQEMSDAGARRISVGSALASLSYGALFQGAGKLADGDMGWVADLAAGSGYRKFVGKSA
ncbi:MAG: isocitrate lyase/phosphoenolpyruvate mutase family protein [Pseudomonadales bacterium]|nr:isocitrate lyase/phosphoenolpyruvate mutase family protein [Pseudomonadales bacterium]